MDASSLDTLVRSLARESATRRSMIGGVAAIAIAALPVTDASAKKKKRCKRKKRCGKDCCNGSSCFAKAVDPTTVTPTSYACCPAKLLCLSPKVPFIDQCCYPDETCQPELAENIEAETICCRPCGSVCCLKQNEECIDGVCTLVDTARLPRARR